MKGPRALPAPLAHGLSPAAPPRRFHVSGRRADGCTFDWHRVGGTAIDHTLDAMDEAGLGGVVRVIPLDLARAA